MDAKKEILLAQISDLQANTRIRTACQIISVDDKGIGECTDGTQKVGIVFPISNPDVQKGDYLLIHGKIIGETNKSISIENYKKISPADFSEFKRLLEELNNKYKELMQLL